MIVSSKLVEDFTSRRTKIRKSEKCIKAVSKDHVKKSNLSKTPKIESKHNTNEDNAVNEAIEAEKKNKQCSDYGNNYVTIIENNGDNVDTDSHNILSSDLAKCLYTNVESSINKLENK